MKQQPHSQPDGDVPDKSIPVEGSHSKHVLGNITPGAFDTKLQGPKGIQQDQQQGPKSIQQDQQQQPSKAVPGLAGLHRVPAALGNAAPHGGAGGHPLPAPGADDDKLQLPHGGLVAMRKSGGFRFTSQEVIIYTDGQVTVQHAAAGGQSSARRLNDVQLAQLYRALEGANLPGLPHTAGQQNPDAYAYEIAAHLGSTIYSVEAFDGSIPHALDLLIQMLTQYLET